MARVVVIGGGISGLAAAHRLLELDPSLDLVLIEASARLGGTLLTEQREGFLVERGPDSFISEKPEAVALAKRLGIESRLIETNSLHRRSFIVRNGRLRPVPEGFQLLAPSRIWPFITSDIFSLTGKVRMAADLFLPRRSANGVADESLASFVRRRLGREALERMAQPMVGGIYTADPETLSLRATLPRFLDMERDHRSVVLAMLRKARLEKTADRGVSGARYGLFLSFDRGMEVFVETLAHALGGCEIKLNTRVVAIERNQGWILRTETDRKIGDKSEDPSRYTTKAQSEGTSEDKSGDLNQSTTGASSEGVVEADAICLALPAYVAAQLISGLDPSLATQLQQIKYASTATINLAYHRAAIKHPLDGFGFVVPFVEKRSLIACTFSNVKFPGRAPADHVLLRAFVGGALQPEMFALDEDEMLRRVESDLQELLGITAKPLFTEVSKWQKSMPQYEVGHLDRVAAIERRVLDLPALALAGNAYRGAGIPDCIRSGETAAETLLNSLAT